MIFLHAQMLYLLTVPLLFFLFSLRSSAKEIKTIFSQSVLARLRVNEQRLQGRVRYRLFLLAVALFIVALARPVTNEKIGADEQELIPLVIALDLSGSMYESDVYPNRLTLAKQKLQSLIEESTNMSIGIILFAKNAYMLYPVSDDIDTLAYMVENLNVNRLKKRFQPNSNLFAALEAGNDMLRHSRVKNMIVLSDGGSSSDYAEEAGYLQKNGLVLYTIGIASKTHPALEKLSEASGGSYQTFSWGSDDVRSVLSQIQKRSETQRFKTYQIKHHTELFMYPLALGILMLFFVFTSIPNIKKSIHTLLLFLFFHLYTTQTPLQAGIFDFMHLKEAQRLYDAKKYPQAAALYQKLAVNSEGYYNLANALYKSRRYKEAITAYRRALNTESVFNAKVLHNIGNCYVQLKQLRLAKKYYEKALKLHPCQATQDNLQRVTQALSAQKKSGKKAQTKVPKMCPSSREGQGRLGDPVSSKYEIKLKNLLLSEEEKWMKLLQNQHSPVFLQKMETKRMSRNVTQAQ